MGNTLGLPLPLFPLPFCCLLFPPIPYLLLLGDDAELLSVMEDDNDDDARPALFVGGGRIAVPAPAPEPPRPPPPPKREEEDNVDAAFVPAPKGNPQRLLLLLAFSPFALLPDDDGDDDDDDDESDGIGILGYSMHSNGGGYKELKCIYRGEPRKISTPGDGTVVHDGSYDLMTMNGRKVYSFATREVPTVLKEALDNAGISVDDVDHLLLHQANIRIMEVVADRLGMPMEKVITNLYKYGNTSAASIPLALDDAVRSGRVKKGDVIACAGFGAGLSWGAAILKWG
mmetsp:Transcript_16829/g.36494  ORF Transcript_16829/g.36494 Transcript_16829/m.36494 type:complete len:286 (-) Transcript_16829:129-986(-)